MNIQGIFKYGQGIINDFKINNKDFKKCLYSFLIILVSLFISIFWEYSVYIALAITCIAMLFIKGGNKFYLLAMLLPFYHIFRFGYEDLVLSSYVLLFAILILGIEFLIALVKHKKKVNWIVSFLFLLITIYVLLPFGPYNWNNIFRVLITIISVYMCFIFKEDIKLKELLFSLMVGLFFAILISPLRHVSDRLENFLPDYFEDGFDKPRFAGLTADPNYFSVEIMLVLAIMTQLYLKDDFKFAFIPSYIFFGYFGFRTLSKSYALIYLFLFLIVSILSVISVVKEPSRSNKLKIIKWFVSNAILWLLSIKVLICLFNRFLDNNSVNFQGGSTILYISMSLMMLLEISTLKGLGSINSLTTGRSEIWAIYFQEIISTPKTFLFGHGIGANLIETNFGFTAAHNFYIELLYHLGVIGSALLLILILYLFIKSSTRHNRQVVNFLSIICIAGMLFSLNSLISYRPYLLIIFLAFSLNYNPNTENDDFKKDILKLNINQSYEDNINNDKNPILSVIIPVYNVEKYIDKCLRSICQLNLTRTEILVINDGTKDNSAKIAKKLSKEFSNIKVYDKENGGLSDARNFGIKKAKGKYLIFIDSDDYIDAEFEKLYDYLHLDCDIFFMGYYAEYIKRQECVDYINFEKADHKNEFIQKLLKINTKNNSAWSKVIKKDFIINNNLYFNDGFAEDYNWLGRAVQYAETGAILPIKYYHYIVEREGSLMNTVKSKRFNMLINHSKSILEELSKNQLNKQDEKIIRQYVGFNLLSGFRFVKKLPKEEQDEVYLQLKNNFEMFKYQKNIFLKIFILGCKIFGLKFMYKFI